MSDWKLFIFSDLCDITRGASPRPIQDYISNVGMPWVKIADATSNDSKFITSTKEYIKLDGVSKSRKVLPGDLILSNSATPGLPKFMGIEACVHDGWMILRNFRNLNKNFAYWLLLNERPKLVAQGNGSIFTNLKTDILKNHIIKVPTIDKQLIIADFLDSIQSKIELNRQINQTLEAMAKALFKSWFVDFEPVRAKLDSRWQRGQSLPGLPAHLYDLFPDRLVESELGEIPEGWVSVSASQLIEFNPSESLKKGTEAPYIEMAALPTSGCWPEPPVARPFGSGMRFRNGDTLLARITPCLENGKTAFVQCLPDNSVGWGSTEYIVMRPKAPVPSEFGYLLARDAAFREQAIRSMTGTSGRQRVQANSVIAFKVAAPPNGSVWDAFSRIVAPPFKNIKANAEAITTLAQLRDTLLPKLISGELRVPDAQAFVKEHC